MDEALQQQLRDRFPHLLGSDAEFKFGNGWFVLVYQFLQELETYKLSYRIGPMHEKWGWLHMRLSSDNVGNPLEYHERFFDLLWIYEWKSYLICEQCSQPGVVRWSFEHIRVLCDACETLYDSPRVERDLPEYTQPGKWRHERAVLHGIRV
jgi:hypothetical protein